MQTEEIKKSLNGGNHKDSTDNAITSVISQQDNYSRGYSVYQPFLLILKDLKISKVNSTVRLCGGINSRISRVYYFTL